MSMYVTVSGTRNPKPGSAAEIVRDQGIAALRGVPLNSDGRIVYVHNGLIDKMIKEAADFPEDAPYQWRERCYGGASPDANLVTWIYLNNATVANGGSAA